MCVFQSQSTHPTSKLRTYNGQWGHFGVRVGAWSWIIYYAYECPRKDSTMMCVCGRELLILLLH